jgi:hypothetical protein
MDDFKRQYLSKFNINLETIRTSKSDLCSCIFTSLEVKYGNNLDLLSSIYTKKRLYSNKKYI